MNFIHQDVTTPISIFNKVYLPALITFPIGILLSPFTWLSNWKTMKIILLFSLLILVFVYAVSFVFDKITENSGYKVLESPQNPPVKNIALYVQLPIATIGIFYFIHPIFGLLFLVIASMYCLMTGIEAISFAREISRLSALTHFIKALIFLFIPLLFFAILMGSLKTIYYIYVY